ncbi:MULTISPECIES: protein rep [Bacilli]|uniref:Protein rep n=2 Tax=Bacilli TaxID=91061 RepID=A0A9D2F8R4_9ENTE|nr:MULTISPECIES: protein rep [Bacilli]MCD5003722.1 protein rep [Enterococcus saccharolyticus]MDM5205419.1 protein rep [Cytobacillus kochii]HIZ54565.1 protein rep [Candidatus Enterococcus avicola]
MIKHTKKKKKNGVLAYFMEKLVSEHLVSANTLELIKECNTFMMMVADESLEKKKQHKGNSCKNRFCPICAWKKARKDALALSVMMAYLKQEEKKEFIFLTLTAPNVSAEELNDEIKHYNQSFQRLMQRKEVRQVVKGYARKLEITYNEERDDYHPHFHVLIAVNKSYFTQTTQYISRDRWLELWQLVTKNPLITQVDVRKVRNGRDDKVYEIAKYSAKDSDYLQNQNVFEVFYNALKGKRLIVFSGLFKEAMTKFKDGDLDGYKEKDMTKYVYAIMYNWGDKKYLEIEKRLLTDEELKEVNGQLIDEKDVD